MQLRLHNSLSGQKETFEPLDSKKEHVTMYVCGPTVYDRPHIGNARAVVVYDVLFRLLNHLYRKVTYARNITDVDDKIMKAAADRGVSVDVITKEVTEFFHADMEALGNLSPTIEPKATEHIGEMITTIEALMENGHAYEAEGHALYKVETAPNYGQLSGKKVEDLIAGARVEVESYKQNPGDFVLWKPSTDDEPGWDSPWGRGRPGWHIECTAMSNKHLGADFDIHGGGADLKFPHHENEIAQGCGAHHGSIYAKYWVHNGFVTVGGEKMSKSLGNFTTVRELLDQGISGDAIRLGLLSAHYRKPLDVRDGLWEEMQKIIDKWSNNAANAVEDGDSSLHPETIFMLALQDDLNIPLAMSEMHRANPNAIRAMADMLGIQLKERKEGDIPLLVLQWKEERDAAKAAKDWATADGLRVLIEEAGYQLQDGKDGSTVTKI